MTLIQNLSAVKQRLYTSIPQSLGVTQYKTVSLSLNGQIYTFTGKVLELAPGQKINYMGLGVNVNNETRYITGIPLLIPLETVTHGTYTYDGTQADVISIETNGTVSYAALVQEYRNR